MISTSGQSQNAHNTLYLDDMDRFDQMADSIQTVYTMYQYNIREGYGMLRLVYFIVYNDIICLYCIIFHALLFSYRLW